MVSSEKEIKTLVLHLKMLCIFSAKGLDRRLAECDVLLTRAAVCHVTFLDVHIVHISHVHAALSGQRQVGHL